MTKSGVRVSMMWEKDGAAMSKADLRVVMRWGGRPLVEWWLGGRSGEEGSWSSTSCIERRCFSFTIFCLMEFRLIVVEQKYM